MCPRCSQLDGTVALDVKIGGTIAKPDFSGSADMNINLARFENATLPALTNFKALLNFRQNRLTFDRFGGDLAGGPFTVSGRSISETDRAEFRSALESQQRARGAER